MTARPPRARGLIDGQTAEILAVTHQGVFRLHSDGSTSDVTPPFSWHCAAAGGGAVALAGPDRLEWRGTDGEVAAAAAPAAGVSHLAVLAQRVAAVSGSGRLTVWERLGAGERSVDLDLEPEGLAFDEDGSRVVAWGWDGAGDSALAVVELDRGGPRVVRPHTPWPPADTGAAPLTGGVLAVGGVDRVVLLARNGQPLTEVELPGLERITGSGAAVGWFRNRGGDDIVVGIGHVDSVRGALTVDAELPVTSADPFPEFAVVRDSVVVTVGVGPRLLEIHRMTAAGWQPTVTVELPDRPATAAEAAPVGE
ncbi:hypothetical protein ACVBEQ_10810 [Nakamurella sp. GG22]